MKRLLSAVCCLLSFAVLAQEAPAPPPATNEDFAKAVFFGRKFADMNDYAAAYDQFAKAEALQPDNPAVLYDMAVLLAKSGRWSEAQRKVDRYVQLYPTGAEKPLVAKLSLSNTAINSIVRRMLRALSRIIRRFAASYVTRMWPSPMKGSMSVFMSRRFPSGVEEPHTGRGFVDQSRASAGRRRRS